MLLLFKRSAQAVVIAVAAVSLSGCVIAVGNHDDDDQSSKYEKIEARNRSQIAQLVLGTPIGEVQALMGPPDFTDAFTSKAGEYRVLRYRTQRVHSDGDTTPDETTPLVFLDRKLSGIGEAAYAKATAE